MKEGQISTPNQTGRTLLSSYNNQMGTITSIFDTADFSEATDLTWARTLLHEAVHAYLYQYFRVNNQNFIDNYPKMVEDYGRLNNWNDVHHEEIARSLVTSIGLSLEEYGKSQGYNLSSQFYKDLAWGGLQETSEFKNRLSSVEKDRINDVIQIELLGKDKDSNTRTQKGSRINCSN